MTLAKASSLIRPKGVWSSAEPDLPDLEKEVDNYYSSMPIR